MHVTGIKRDIRRSEKPRMQRFQVKREVLSQGQIDIQRYLGMQLEGEEEKRNI